MRPLRFYALFAACWLLCPGFMLCEAQEQSESRSLADILEQLGKDIQRENSDDALTDETTSGAQGSNSDSFAAGKIAPEYLNAHEQRALDVYLEDRQKQKIYQRQLADHKARVRLSGQRWAASGSPAPVPQPNYVELTTEESGVARFGCSLPYLDSLSELERQTLLRLLRKAKGEEP